MKRKILKIFITISFLFCIYLFNDGKVLAKQCSDKQTLLQCNYTSKHSASKLKNISFFVKKSGDQEKLSTSDLGKQVLDVNSYAQNNNTLVLSDFIDGKGNYKCPQELYITGAWGNVRGAHTITHWDIGINPSNSAGTEKASLKSSCKAKKADKNNKSTSKISKCYYGNGAIITIDKSNKKLSSSVDINLKYKDLKNNMCPIWICEKTTSGADRVPDRMDYTYSYSEKDPSGSENQYVSQKCYSGTSYGSDYKCLYLANYMNDVTSKNYKSSDIKKVNKYNHDKTLVMSYCKSATANYNYMNTGVEATCLKECLQIGKDIAEIEGGLSKTGGCNLTEKIVAFIDNILKWLKYIAPVLVIILGILDFIRALAASDDDAMKKAQKRFITRLIAAVLLFLLPLIIDYVLRIFGLYRESCDITEIFK